MNLLIALTELQIKNITIQVHLKLFNISSLRNCIVFKNDGRTIAYWHAKNAFRPLPHIIYKQNILKYKTYIQVKLVKLLKAI